MKLESSGDVYLCGSDPGKRNVFGETSREPETDPVVSSDSASQEDSSVSLQHTPRQLVTFDLITETQQCGIISTD